MGELDSHRVFKLMPRDGEEDRSPSLAATLAGHPLIALTGHQPDLMSGGRPEGDLRRVVDDDRLADRHHLASTVGGEGEGGLLMREREKPNG